MARPDSEPAAKATVARALVLSDKAWSQRLSDWRLASWTVRVRVVQAQLARRDGRLQDAESTLLRAADQASASLQEAHSVEGQLYLATGLANVHLNLAQVYDHGNLPSLQRPEYALREYRRAEQALQASLARKADLAELDRKAAPGDVSTAAYLVHQIAVIHGGRALVHLRQDQLPEMRLEAEAAVALMRQNVTGEPRNVAWRDGLMTESNTLAQARLRLGDRDGALAAAQEAWDIAQALARDEGPQSKWAHASVQALLAGLLGRALLAQGRAADALPLLEQTRVHWRAQGAVPDARRRAAAFELCAAQAQMALGLPDEACKRALHVVDQLVPLCEEPAGDDRPARTLHRDAWLTRAEAHALLIDCQPGGRDRHRAQALAALSKAQAQHPLALDHQALLARLQG